MSNIISHECGTTGDMPQTLAIFPLPGVVLLPRARLPLNVFEPRYLAMVQDVLGLPGRMIGIIQPSDNSVKETAATKIYQIGCAGRITSFNETEDGRFLISLTGICRFVVKEEVPADKVYRVVRTDWRPFEKDLIEMQDEEIDRKRLLAVLRDYFKSHEISADWNAVQNTPNDALISSLVMISPLAPNEKQALLECESLQSRADMLITLLEMAAFPQPESEGGIRH